MPLMVEIRRAVVFGGERGEGLQKTQKLAVYADELLVVSEAPPTQPSLTLPAGRLSEVNEDLRLAAERVIPIHPLRAAEADLDALIAGASFVTSDLADRSLNERIRSVAARHNVLCNIIDTRDLCNVWFMSLIETDHLVAGFSSKAKATFYLTQLRARLQPQFRRWEKEAAFVAAVRNQLAPSQRKHGLPKVWSSLLIRVCLRCGLSDLALRLAQPQISRLNRVPKENPA